MLGVVASPLVFWLLIGYGSNDLARFYSGALVLTVMFSAIFSTISIIEDRREGFLLSMMVSPAPRTSLVLGKILGLGDAGVDPGADLPRASRRWPACSISPSELIPVAAAIFLISFTLTGLGFVIAWKMDSTAGFHAIMNLLLVPMWMVSGSLFPMATAHGWVKAIMWVNPLTYSISLLNHTLRLPNAAPGAAGEPGGDGGVRAGAAAGLRRDGRAEGDAERGMRRGCGRHRRSARCVLRLRSAGCLCQAEAAAGLRRGPAVPARRPQTGQPFDSQSLDGHIWVADFIYTTCDGPCPMMSRRCGSIQDQTAAEMPGREAGFVHGGPGARHAAGAGRIRQALQAPIPTRWSFLTGEQARAQRPRPERLQAERGGRQHDPQHALRAGGPAAPDSRLLHHRRRRLHAAS